LIDESFSKHWIEKQTNVWYYGNSKEQEAMVQKDHESEEPISSEGGSTYEFRWDVEVPTDERRFGQRFTKQWKRVLQAQKMASLVSAKLSPQGARFQLCVTHETGQQYILEREAEIAEELGHLRWANGLPAEQCIAGEPAGTHPAGWQGVRIWMTFARQDVESALAKKPRI
jgi:hypothetical protein